MIQYSEEEVQILVANSWQSGYEQGVKTTCENFAPIVKARGYNTRNELMRKFNLLMKENGWTLPYGKVLADYLKK